MGKIIFSCFLGLIVLLFAFALFSASKSFNEKEKKAISTLKQGNCVLIEVIESNSPISSTQYRYKCESDKFFTLNKDYRSELGQPKQSLQNGS